MTEATRPAVEASYLETLGALETMFQSRLFVLGDRPTEADFGFFGPFFKHFFCDPTPGRIMRERAPGVLEWAARMWDLNPSRASSGPRPSKLPDGLDPILKAVAEACLPYLQANDLAVARAEPTVSYEAQGVSWTEPSKPSRRWCLDRLRRKYTSLDERGQRIVAEAISSDRALEILGTPAQNVPDLAALRGDGSTVLDSWWRPRGEP